MAFSPANDLLAAGTADRRVVVWNTASGRVAHSFGGQEYAIRQIAFRADGRKVTTMAADGTVRVYWLDLKELQDQARKLLAAWPK